MSRRYALARLGATLEGVPELTARLNALGTRFEGMRVSADATAASPEIGRVTLVFENLYRDAEVALADAADRATAPADLIAFEEALRRVEAAFEEYRVLISGAAPSRRRGSAMPLLLGIALFGGVVLLSRKTRR